MKKVTFFWLVAVLACNGLAFGQVWNEVGDAGELLGTAQTPVGGGPLTTIIGVRGPDADMYLIFIPDPALFEAKTWPFSAGDTQLWLFDTDGIGISFNDDDAQQGLLSRITGQFLPGPGDYYLAVSTYDYDALNPDGDEIWLDHPFQDERAPDGPGAPGPLAVWDGAGGQSPLSYQIDLIGVEFVVSPCPWDLDGSGSVGASDLLALLTYYGMPCKDCPFDFDGDGNVGASDLLALLFHWGPCP